MLVVTIGLSESPGPLQLPFRTTDSTHANRVGDLRTKLVSVGRPEGMGGGGFARSFRQDEAIKDYRLRAGTVRRVLQFARPHAAPIAVFLLFVIAGALLVVATPLLLQRIIDDGVANGNRRLVIVLASLVAAIAIGESVLLLLQRWFSARIGENLIYHLRSAVFSNVQAQSLSFFTHTQTGSLVTRLNSDVIGAQQAFTSTLSGVVSNVISVTIVVATMLVLSWQITVIALLIVPALLLPARSVGRRLAGLRRRSMELNAELGNRMTERFNVAGALLVKLYGSPAVENSEFAARAASVRDIGVKTAMSSRVFFTALGAMASLATAVVYGAGGWMAIDGSMTVGTLVAFAGLLGRLYGPVTALSNVQVDVMTALVSFERVFEILDLEPSIVDSPEAVELPPGPLGLAFEHVSFAYPARGRASLSSLAGPADGPTESEEAPHEIIHEVSVQVPPGSMLALVGPSGAGKTTLSMLIPRVYDPTQGAVRINGLDLRNVRLSALRDAVGVVTQDSHLFHDTIRANLTYARRDATDEELHSALRAAQLERLIARLPQGLETIVGDRGHRLSGGEKQRVAIARMLLRGPRIVVLDEATAHLDSESESALQVALENALAGRTSVVIAHRLSTVRRADNIVVLRDGRIVEQGDHAALLAARGLYWELYETQTLTRD
jgi:ATP-binding cassette, subfamily B, bacterial